MEIDADVKSITKLEDYFFIVPDYQREFVWKPEEQVDRFIIDITNEYDPHNNHDQRSYFIGSIILVKNGEKFNVIDGQQRLTTIIISLIAFRDLLDSHKKEDLNQKTNEYLSNLKNLISKFDVGSDKNQIRLELQYEESKDFLDKLINKEKFEDQKTPSIIKMEGAYEHIKNQFSAYLEESLESLIQFIRFFLTKIELVVIETKDLGSALKIFETINQRGVGLNAMDLFKNLLFSQVNEEHFQQIKELWKNITANLQKCNEDGNPLRFLRYFLMARYYNGILREDDIYKWIISDDGREKTEYDERPLDLAKEIEKSSRLYAGFVQSTELLNDGSYYPSITNIGYINKYKSRQHIILLLALNQNTDKEVIEYLAKQIESFFFYSISLKIQAKDNERLFVSWASKLRGKSNIDEINDIVKGSMLPYLKKKLKDFTPTFHYIHDYNYKPLYRLRFILGKLENTIRQKAGYPVHGHRFINNLHVEHIFPQTPKNGVLPDQFDNEEEYKEYVHRLGNITLIEGRINQAVNNFNELDNNWFESKQGEYSNSALLISALLNDQYTMGKDTALNRFKKEVSYEFKVWDKDSIEKRQEMLYQLVLDTWKINGKRIDE